MNTKDKRHQKKVILISACTIFALLLIIALIANLISLGVKNRRIERLKQDIAYYNEQYALNESELDYRKSPEYIENFARDYLEMKKTNEEAIKSK